MPVSADGLTYTPEFKQITFLTDTSGTFPQKFTLYKGQTPGAPPLDDEERPIVFVDFSTGYQTFPISTLGLLEGNQIDNATNPQLYRLLQNRIDVVVYDVPGPYQLATGIQTPAPPTGPKGRGLFHAPGWASPPEGDQPVDTDGWSDDDQLIAPLVAARCIQFVRRNAELYKVTKEPRLTGLAGSSGSLISSSQGSASATIAAIALLAEDQAIAGAGDYREESSLVLGGIYIANAQLDFTKFKKATALSGIVPFADQANALLDPAPTFGDVAPGVLKAMSAVAMVRANADIRERIATGPAFYLFSGGFDGASVVNSGFTGEDRADLGKVPDWGTDDTTKVDFTDNDDLHHWVDEYNMMQQLLDIQGTDIKGLPYHATHSKLVYSAATVTSALGAGLAQLWDVSTQEANENVNRPLEEARWWVDVFEYQKLHLAGDQEADSTELDMVNEVLDAVGERPITGFEGQTSNVLRARRMLETNSRKVQSRGWQWNTRREVERQPNGSGRIELPAEVLSSNEARNHYQEEQFIKKGDCLFDQTPGKNTFEFTEKVTLDEVDLLPYTEIPEAFRRWIVRLTAVEYQMATQRNTQLDRQLRAQAQEAEDEARTEETRIVDANVFAGNNAAAWAVNRRRTPRRRF